MTTAAEALSGEVKALALSDVIAKSTSAHNPALATAWPGRTVIPPP